MTQGRPKPVVIDFKGGKFWEVPDALWRKVPALQAIRLRRTVSDQILPLLNQLDDLFPRPKGSKIHRIKGKSLDEIISDVACTDLALHLFDIAFEQNLLSFASKAKKPDANSAVGSCGMSIAEARRLILEGAARHILKQAGHKPKSLSKMLGGYEMNDPSSLHKLKLMAKFDPLTLSELKKGLGNDMAQLFDRDEEYFRVLREAKPTNFLRPLRTALGKHFPAILEWDGAFINAVAEGLEHSAKIVALGTSLLEIDDPDVVRALGRWTMKETIIKDKDKDKGNRRAYVTRIDQVRRQFGDQFEKLLKTNAAIIDQAATWSAEEIEKIKFHITFLNGDVFDALSELPFAYAVGIFDGLWSTLGRDFMENKLTTPEAISALRAIAAKITEMGTDSTTPAKVTGLIEKKFFDEHLDQFS